MALLLLHGYCCSLCSAVVVVVGRAVRRVLQIEHSRKSNIASQQLDCPENVLSVCFSFHLRLRFDSA